MSAIKTTKNARRITGLIVDEISLVDKAANGEPALLYKAEQDEPVIEMDYDKSGIMSLLGMAKHPGHDDQSVHGGGGGGDSSGTSKQKVADGHANFARTLATSISAGRDVAKIAKQIKDGASALRRDAERAGASNEEKKEIEKHLDVAEFSASNVAKYIKNEDHAGAKDAAENAANRYYDAAVVLSKRGGDTNKITMENVPELAIYKRDDEQAIKVDYDSARVMGLLGL